MAICIAPTLQLTHIMYTKMENFINISNLTKIYHIDKGSSITVKDAHTHAHTHAVQTDRGKGQCCLTEIF